MSDVQDFAAAMAEHGWHYSRLEQLCDDHMRLFLESYRVLQLCEQFRAMTARALEALARERAAGLELGGQLPWDYTRGYPLPRDLC